MPFAEICTWVPLDLSTYESNVKPSVTMILEADGRNSVYSGLVEEDGTRVYLIIVWESPFDRDVHMADPESIRNVISSATRPGGEFKTSLVQFNNEVNSALNAPRTEITLFKLKEGVSNNDLQNVLESVIENHHVANSKFGPMTWGPIQGEPDQFYLLFGWESSKAHRDTVADPSFLQFVTDLLEAVDFESCHGDLSKQSLPERNE